MNYHNITTDDMLNGDGLRTVLWTAGCSHHCHGCHNPITWDGNGGLPFDEKAEDELFSDLSKPYISGITFSGGDPLFEQNRSEVGRLIRRFVSEFPNKTVWLYTGYVWEDICDLPFIKYVDVLVDGRFEQARADKKIHWAGSSNQRVIDVKKTLEKGDVVLHN